MNNKTTQIAILMIALTLASFGGYMYATRYIGSLTEKTSKLKSDIELAEIKNRNLQTLQRAAQNTGDEKEKITSYFVGKDGAVSFVSEIEGLAAASNLKYTTDTIETTNLPELEGQGKELLHVVFTSNGSWNNTVKFLSLLESLPYSMRIEKLDFDSARLDAAAGTSTPASSRSWKMTINFSVVKIKDNAR